MLVATVVVKCDRVLVAEFPQAQVASGMVVTIWFTVLCATEPPSSAIGGAPHALLLVVGVHCRVSASATTIPVFGDVNDPVWSLEWLSRCQNSPPIASGCWGEDLGASGAAVLVQRFAHIQAVLASNHGSSRVISVESDAFALAALGAAWVWLCGYLLNARAFDGFLALRQHWKWYKLFLLV